MYKGERFTVRFAVTEEEKNAAYRLRYHDMLLQFRSDALSENGLDKTPCDEYARQIVCIDNETGEIVGCYRMITTDELPCGENFVSEEEFCLDGLKATGESIVELSRAVVKTEYRTSPVLFLLLRFIVIYVRQCGYRFVIGDASFFGTDKDALAPALSFLADKFAIDDKLNIVSREERQATVIPPKLRNDNEIRRSLPPLIKAYTSFGARVSKTSFTDYDFGSVDVFILLDVKNCNDSYINRMLKI